jgi:cytosine/adenosine deaminase-related metal-dependent hydrolase
VATKKLSITLPAELADDVERLARERGLPVSTWLAEAAQEARRHHAALAAIADYEAEFGRFTEAELADARARLARMDAVAATPKRGRSGRNAA